ncbi:MAG: transglycosylase domain-containing protein, partial [Alphaproteobacteria bacterium]
MQGRWFLIVAAGLALTGYGRDRADQWIDATDLPALVLPTSQEVTDRHGDLLRAYTVADGRWRLAASNGKIDPFFVQLLLTYEDRRFYSHDGVDARALLRATWQAVSTGRIASGGSTLTMQVAGFLDPALAPRGAARTLGQKWDQAQMALQLERQWSKAEILEAYLNLAPYRGELSGLAAAAYGLFGKSPSGLDGAEAALLVALLRGTNATAAVVATRACGVA